MDRDEAKNILQLCRPESEADHSDPLIAEALALLETDATLRLWFEDQQAFDATISAGLEAIEPPADLQASILAGMKAHQLHSETAVEFEEPQVELSERTQTSWWRNPWVGIAALFVFMLALTNLPNGKQDTQLAQNDPALSGFPQVLPFLSDKIDDMNMFSFDERNADATQLQSYLASTGAPAPKKLCSKLASTPTIGCVTFDYNDSKLSMICFKNGEVYHLITADAANFPEACPLNPKIYEIKDKAFKVWVEGDQLKILTIHGTKEDIPEYI